jgi:SAM-dependent methyltransferase
MAEINTGIRAILQNPWVYEFFQFALGASIVRRRFVDRHVRPRKGDRILDIGCGPAELLRFMPGVEYVGFDPSPDYIARAKQRFAGQGEFFAKYFDQKDADALAPFDIIIVSAVLHHMDDEDARKLFEMLRPILKPGGRVVTLDPVFIPQQNPIARKLIAMDRGQNVRSQEGYVGLAKDTFQHVEGVLAHRVFPPYTHWIMSARQS